MVRVAILVVTAIVVVAVEMVMVSVLGAMVVLGVRG